jgi:UDP-glucose 4-epimerase
MEKVLITGAGGFVGRMLVLQVIKNERPSDVLCYIRDGEKDSISHLGARVRKVDLVNGNGLERLNVAPDSIFHLAASTDTSTPDHRCNDQGTINLLSSLGSLKSDNHLIFASSTAVYAGRTDCSKPINELTRPVPSNEYGRTKLTAEEFLRKTCKKRNFRLTIVRLSTVFGKGTRKNGLFDILKKSIKRESIASRLNWPGLTSLVHVEDVAEALVSISQKPPRPGKPELFVLYSQSLSLSDISRLMHRKLRAEYKQIKVPSFCWRTLGDLKILTRVLEAILTPRLYNIFWRMGLVVEDALHCESGKFLKRFPQWKPRRFEDNVSEVL